MEGAQLKHLKRYLVIKVFGYDMNVSGLLHLFRALHAEANLGDFTDNVRFTILLLHHIECLSSGGFECKSTNAKFICSPFRPSVTAFWYAVILQSTVRTDDKMIANAFTKCFPN